MMTRTVSLTLLAILAAGASAQSIDFKVGAGRASQQIATVESVTDFETFTGVTSNVKGTLSFDRAKRTGSGNIIVDVASIKTGIDLRDEHLREPRWMDATKFPTIQFVSESVKHVRGDTYRVSGKFTMRGVTKQVTTDVTLKHLKESEATTNAGFKGDVLQVKAKFDVKLSDYGVTVPGGPSAKVANTVTIGLTVYGQSKA